MRQPVLLDSIGLAWQLFLMFCEDAARRLHGALALQSSFVQVAIGVEHHESLHAHNAVGLTSWKRGEYVA